jgi:c(7)-type cytochrome triheme protein
MRMKRLVIQFLAIFLLLFVVGSGQSFGAGKYGGGPIVFILPVRAVIFEHKFHLGKNFTCVTCHPGIFPKNAGEVEKRDDFTMDSFNKGKYCGTCHNGTTAFSVNTKCNWCHIGVQGYKKLEEYQLGIK